MVNYFAETAKSTVSSAVENSSQKHLLEKTISLTRALSYSISTFVFICMMVVTLPVMTSSVATRSYFQTKVSPSRQIESKVVNRIPNAQIVVSSVTSA